MRRPLIVAAVLATAGALAAVAGVGLGWWDRAPAGAAPAAPLVVRTALSPQASLFGDPLVARVDVLLDPAVVDADSVKVTTAFVPYVERVAPTVQRTRSGRLELVRYRYTIQCVTDGCLPVGAVRAIRLAPVRVTATAGGRTVAKDASWPRALVEPRVQPSDLVPAKLPFRHPRTLPAPEFAIAPGPLAAGLTAAAAVLVFAGLALLGLEARRRRSRAAHARMSPREAALAYVREAAGRPDPADRRKALSLLAETLAGESRDLADAADGVAWGEHAPSPARTVQVADEVEGRAGR
jgi:hypothetical protein